MHGVWAGDMVRGHHNDNVLVLRVGGGDFPIVYYVNYTCDYENLCCS